LTLPRADPQLCVRLSFNSKDSHYVNVIVDRVALVAGGEGIMAASYDQCFPANHQSLIRWRQHSISVWSAGRLGQTDNVSVRPIAAFRYAAVASSLLHSSAPHLFL
jgi:hypothetical protein